MDCAQSGFLCSFMQVSTFLLCSFRLLLHDYLVCCCLEWVLNTGREWNMCEDKREKDRHLLCLCTILNKSVSKSWSLSPPGKWILWFSLWFLQDYFFGAVWKGSFKIVLQLDVQEWNTCENIKTLWVMVREWYTLKIFYFELLSYNVPFLLLTYVICGRSLLLCRMPLVHSSQVF